MSLKEKEEEEDTERKKERKKDEEEGGGLGLGFVREIVGRRNQHAKAVKEEAAQLRVQFIIVVSSAVPH